MKRIQLVTALFIVPAFIALAQTSTAPPLEIVSYKIGSDYYPMLDSKPSLTTADNPDFPRTEAEINARRTRRTTREDAASRGKLRSEIKVTGTAQWVSLTVKNTGAQPIKTLHWEFAFLRLEQGQLALRYSVVSQTEIKPGAKKTFREPLPPGATRCKVVNVRAEAEQEGKAKTTEFVCGRGFADPSLLREKLEPVVLQRIEYADGSVWSLTKE